VKYIIALLLFFICLEIQNASSKYIESDSLDVGKRNKSIRQWNDSLLKVSDDSCSDVWKAGRCRRLKKKKKCGRSTVRKKCKKTCGQCADKVACGISPNRIIGGSPVAPNSIPWQVGLVPRGSYRTFCGGTLICPNVVLTAAHCEASSFDEVIVGEHELNNPKGTRHRIQRVTNHPNYNKRNLNYDFAIIQLKDPVRLGANAVPACLADSSMDEKFLIKKQAVVSGWGTLPSGNQAIVLNSVSVPIISNKKCRKLYAPYYGPKGIISAMLCAGNVKNGGIDACSGDSGGPLTYTTDGKAYLVGVVSFGGIERDGELPCGQEELPGVYARVSSVRSWIDAQLTKYC